MLSAIRSSRGLSVLIIVIAFLLVACSSSSVPTVPTPSPAPASSPPATIPPIESPTPTAAPPTSVPATQPATATPTPVANTPTVPPPTDVATNTPASTPTLVAPATAVPTPSASPDSGYRDDRSDGAAVIQSYYNAVNHHEFARAYYYWEANAQGLAPFPDFEKGYANTVSVGLTIGTISSDVGAGQLYYSVPVLLVATNKDGTRQSFVGCYVLHLGSPSAQGVPPFQPLGIRSAQVAVASPDKSTADLLAAACPVLGQVIPPRPTPDPTDISGSRYLDDRSTAESVIRSYYNAINRFEYLRAYSYWQPGIAASQLPPFSDFQKGYAQTKSVQIRTATVTQDLGAGQIHDSVPVTLIATMQNGTTQTFVGCYNLHLARPEFQGVPPFQARAIESANIRAVPNNANTATLMAQGCH